MIKSKVFVLLASSILLQSFSLLSIKYATISGSGNIFLFIFLAFVFMGFRAIVWQFLLNIADLSTVYPFASLVQVLIVLYAYFIFGESITIYNIFGLGIMLGGVYYLSRKIPVE